MARQYAKVTVKSRKLVTPKLALRMPKLNLRAPANGKRKV